MRKPLNTITVAELRDLLADEDPDALVVFVADYGDYHHTQQALPVRGKFEEVEVEESAYSDSGWALRREDDSWYGDDDDDENEEEEEEERPTFLAIR